MAVNATTIFQTHPECYDEKTYKAFIQHHKNPFGFNSLKFITSVDESKELNDMEGPMIIISADGMCEFGRVVHHLYNNIEKNTTIVLLVGFMAHDTLGRRLQDREKEVKILGDWLRVRSDVVQINAFSAHADYKEMGEWLDSFDTSRLKGIFLVHGESKSQSHLKSYLEKKNYQNIQIIKYDGTYIL